MVIYRAYVVGMLCRLRLFFLSLERDQTHALFRVVRTCMLHFVNVSVIGQNFKLSSYTVNKNTYYNSLVHLFVLSCPRSIYIYIFTNLLNIIIFAAISNNLRNCPPANAIGQNFLKESTTSNSRFVFVDNFIADQPHVYFSYCLPYTYVAAVNIKAF